MVEKLVLSLLTISFVGLCQAGECSKWTQDEFTEAFKNFGQRITEKRVCMAYNADGIGLSNTVRLDDAIPDPTIFSCKGDELTVELPNSAVCMSMRRDETADKNKANSDQYACVSKAGGGPMGGRWMYLSDTSASLEISLKDGTTMITSGITGDIMKKGNCQKEWIAHLSGQFKPNFAVLLARSVNGLELKAGAKVLNLQSKRIVNIDMPTGTTSLVPNAGKCWLNAESNGDLLNQLTDNLNEKAFDNLENKHMSTFYDKHGFSDAIHWLAKEGPWEYQATFTFPKPTVECVSCPDPDVALLIFKGVKGIVFGTFPEAATNCFNGEPELLNAKVNSVDVRVFTHTNGELDASAGTVELVPRKSADKEKCK